MKPFNFDKKLTSQQLKENISKLFNVNVNLDKYSREQLEDIRNQIRTKVFQYENQAGFNELLTDETYQKDTAILKLLNTRIKEMLGEDIKKLKDKMIELSEAKKGVKAPIYKKHPIKAKGPDDFKKKKAKKKAGPFKFKEEHDQDDDDVKYDPKKDTSKPLKGDPKAADELSAAMGIKKPELKGTARVHKVKEAAGKKKDKKVNPYAVGMAAAKKSAGYGSKPAHDLPKSIVVKGHEIAKKIKGKKDEGQDMFRKNVKIVNENLARLLNEDEEGKAKAITAASDIVNDYTSWMQRVGQYQTKTMIELADAIRADFGPTEAEAFKNAVAPALSATLKTMMQQREAISNAVAVLAGEDMPQSPMGMEPEIGPGTPDMETGLEPSEPDFMNEPGDEFGASDAAAGGPEAAGREIRESTFQQKLAESHNLISKLAR